jgi:hypothetical protein
MRFGKPMTSAHFSNVFQEVTGTHLNLPIGLAGWRQLSKTVYRHLLDIQLDDGVVTEEQESDSLLLQFGHLEETTGQQIYGLEHTHLREDFSDTAFGNFLRASIRVHRFNKLFFPATSLADAGMHASNVTLKLSELLVNIENLLKSTVQRPDMEDIISQEVNKRLEIIYPKLQDSVTRAINESVPWTHHMQSNGPAPVTANSEAVTIQTAVLVHPSRFHALRLVYNHMDVSFKSVEQSELFELVCQRQHHVVGVLRTGGGKSLLFYGPAAVEKGVTVVITPLVALHEQHLNNASSFGIPFADFGSSSFNYRITKLLFVPAHKTTDGQFINQLKALHAVQALNRIIVDESHHILVSSDFRPCFSLLDVLSQLNVPIVLLTATLSPVSVLSLLACMRLEPSTVQVIRGPTYRTEIGYSAYQVSPDELIPQTMMQMTQTSAHFKQRDRGIVFCCSIDLCRELASLTGNPVYVGPMESTDKSVNAKKWREGRHDWIIATSAFSEGVDYSHVRVVINAGNPSGMTEYQQMTGRAGRDGHQARAIFIFTQPLSIVDVPYPDHKGQVALYYYMTRTEQCRRIEIGLHMDGKAHTCSSIPNARFCDHCIRATVSPCRSDPLTMLNPNT